MDNYKRIDLSDRIAIQASIEKGYSLAETALRIKKSPSSVYREITNNSYCKSARKTCSHCAKACVIKPKFILGECPEFVPSFCGKLSNFPYVCNTCEKKNFCRNEKRYYNCEKANERAEKLKSYTRQKKKFNPTDRIIKAIDNILKDRISKRQGLYHIWASTQIIHENMSERTLRRYIYAGFFEIKAHNLPNYVKLSHKKKEYNPRKKLDTIRLEHRTYKYYLEEINKSGRDYEFQYDSVIGLKSDTQSILTITHAQTNFQFGYLIEKGKTESVNSAISHLKSVFGSDYKEIFKINLCDNGSEFDRFYLNESIHENVKVFYTDPYKSYHKPECERNHEFIRFIFQKHTSLDNVKQGDLDLMFSHINSYIRKELGGKTPYELFAKQFGEEVVTKINIKKIKPENVNLTPSLL